MDFSNGLSDDPVVMNECPLLHLLLEDGG
jgi:hypothetical protein